VRVGVDPLVGFMEEKIFNYLFLTLANFPIQYV
jgi:hypothetical protein